MQTLTGHLTATEKRHIKAILDLGYTSGTVNRKTYQIKEENGIYTVSVTQMDRGLGMIGAALRQSTYKHTFKL